MKKRVTIISIGLLLLAFAQVASAQDQPFMLKAAAEVNPEQPKEGDKTTDKKNKADATTPNGDPAPQAKQEDKLSRWFELQNFTIAARYRTITDSADTRAYNQAQHREILDAKFKFDSKGKYTLNAHVSSGYYFNWAFADTGWGSTGDTTAGPLVHDVTPYLARDVIPGVVNSTVQNILRTQYAGAPASVIAQLTPILTAAVTAQVTPIILKQVEAATLVQIKTINSTGWNLYTRQFYFSAKPVEGVEFQYGGLGILHGVNSEATSYDDDGYVSGGRISIKRPKNLYFDEVSVTYAYLGDIFKPNFFRRTSRLGQSNYHQFLVRKKFGTRADVSADYTFQDGVDTMREAVKVNVKESKVLDWFRFETYQRIGDNTFAGTAGVFKAGKGFGVQAEKTIKDKVNVGGGYTQIDHDYTSLFPAARPFGFALNGDKTGLGNRIFGYADYKVSPMVTLNAYVSKPIKMSTENFFWDKNYLTIGVTFDALKALKKAGLFK